MIASRLLGSVHQATLETSEKGFRASDSDMFVYLYISMALRVVLLTTFFCYCSSRS